MESHAARIRWAVEALNAERLLVTRDARNRGQAALIKNRPELESRMTLSGEAPSLIAKFRAILFFELQ